MTSDMNAEIFASSLHSAARAESKYLSSPGEL
jgi:hypothetical protein